MIFWHPGFELRKLLIALMLIIAFPILYVMILLGVGAIKYSHTGSSCF